MEFFVFFFFFLVPALNLGISFVILKKVKLLNSCKVEYKNNKGGEYDDE